MFSSTVSPGKIPRASGTRSSPRARSERRLAGDVAAVELHVAERRLDHPGGDRAERRLPGAVRAEQGGDLPGVEAEVDAVEHLRVAVTRHDRSQHERRAVEAFSVSRDRRRGQGAVDMDDLVVGDRARVRGRLGRRDAFPTPLFTLLPSRCWPTSERMPSGSWARLIAARPDRIGMKYTEVISVFTSSPSVTNREDRQLAIQWKIAVPAANAKPARSAPPGRRMPNVTASASQNSPAYTGAYDGFAADAEVEEAQHHAAEAGDAGREREDEDFVRLTRMPDACGRDFGASHRQHRPSGRRSIERVDDQGDDAEHREEQRICSGTWLKSISVGRPSRSGCSPS